MNKDENKESNSTVLCSEDRAGKFKGTTENFHFVIIKIS